jgi:hypothetical protein
MLSTNWEIFWFSWCANTITIWLNMDTYCIQYNYITYWIQYATWHAQYDTITIQYSKKCIVIVFGQPYKGQQRTLQNLGSNLVEPTRDQRNVRVASRWKASTDQAPTTLLCSINIARHRYIITTVPHTSMKLLQPIVHGYAANWMLDHEMFDKLRTTIFCLHVEIHAIKKFQEDSRRCSVTVRVSCWCIGVFNCPFTLLFRISRHANSLYIHTTSERCQGLTSWSQTT